VFMLNLSEAVRWIGLGLTREQIQLLRLNYNNCHNYVDLL